MIDRDKLAKVAQETERRLVEERLKPSRLLSELDQIAELLDAHWQTLTRPQVEALKLRASLTIELLKKAVPDLKSIEPAGANDKAVQYVMEAPVKVADKAASTSVVELRLKKRGKS